MKAVLLSIKPKYCELIANGKKTVEIRKTKPKIDTPFKCYIYCSKETSKYAFRLYINSDVGRKEFGITENWRSGKEVVDVNSHLPHIRYNSYLAEGKVIGEFVCDRIDEIIPCYDYYSDYYDINDDVFPETCLTMQELHEYGKGKKLYGWHICELKICNAPQKLSEFDKPCKYEISGYDCFHCNMSRYSSNGILYCFREIEKPPQSWCYVEEMI